MKRFDMPKFDFNGILLVDKPGEWTSHDVVNFIRGRFNIPKVGHCGTLDPAAEGLLVVVTGTFTKLSQKFSGEDKVYEAVIQLGTETDSYDLDGNIVAEKDWSSVSAEQLRQTIKSFVGEQKQLPPMVSAVKKDGKRLYQLARQGIEVDRNPKDINISSIDISEINLPHAKFTMHCSKGTYVRTLCHDIGERLNCGAVLSYLKRVKSGIFELKDAVKVEPLRDWTQEQLREHMSKFLFELVSKNKQLSDF